MALQTLQCKLHVDVLMCLGRWLPEGHSFDLTVVTLAGLSLVTNQFNDGDTWWVAVRCTKIQIGRRWYLTGNLDIHISIGTYGLQSTSWLQECNMARNRIAKIEATGGMRLQVSRNRSCEYDGTQGPSVYNISLFSFHANVIESIEQQMASSARRSSPKKSLGPSGGANPPFFQLSVYN